MAPGFLNEKNQGFLAAQKAMASRHANARLLGDALGGGTSKPAPSRAQAGPKL